MNYRHGFHAGNHADVLKHVALMTLINYLQTKDKPLFILDTHAGPGRYDLASPEAQKSGEYRHGIGRILGAADVPEAMKPYLDAIHVENQGGGITAYPGSPLLLARKLRPQDRLIACDLHPKEAETLAETLYPFTGARVRAGDGYAAAKALLPPPERRGLVLIDPPFEKTTEFADLAKALREAWKRFPVGVYLVWYPLKDRAAANALQADVVAAGMKDATTYELYVRDPAASPGMAGSGVLAINASFALDGVMRAAGPYLAKQLAQGPGSRFTAARLTAE